MQAYKKTFLSYTSRPSIKTKSSPRNVKQFYKTPCRSLLRRLEVQDTMPCSSFSTKHRRTAYKLQHCLARDQPLSETLKSIHRNEAAGPSLAAASLHVPQCHYFIQRQAARNENETANKAALTQSMLKTMQYTATLQGMSPAT